MLALHGATLLLAAFLLFAVQPMIAKAYLPILGGAPAVWTTCVAFFQIALLLGYAYAHAIVGWLGPRRSALTHLGMLVLVVVLADGTLLPGVRDPRTYQSGPRLWLLASLAVTVGLPFVVVAATSPMLQRWFASSAHPRAADPYHLYAASNLGSLSALVAYPAILEPTMALEQQASLWWTGFLGLVGLLALCVAVLWSGPRVIPERRESARIRDRSKPVSAIRWMRWAGLAFIPSSWMLGVTAYLSTDIAAVPLLWVVPLALYLVTLILAFAHSSIGSQNWATRLFPVLVMLLCPALAAGLVQPFWIPVHLITFFLGSLVCHGELVRDRPEPNQLTSFYLALATGGAAGGLFNALLAPVLFDRIAEYPLALVFALLVVPGKTAPGDPGSHVQSRNRLDLAMPLVVLILAAALVRDIWKVAETLTGVLMLMVVTGLMALACARYRSRPIRFALTIGAVLLACGLAEGVDGRLLWRERTFFGALRVTYEPKHDLHRLFHGSTLHGQQSVKPDCRDIPLSYFHPSGPIGQVFQTGRTNPTRLRVAIVGLGVGSLAAYAQPGETWSFYEIDPAVVRIASDSRFFTYLQDCRARRLRCVLGDARLSLTEAGDRSFDLIVLDAFSSDALPVHLMTREAIALYVRKLAPGGRLAFNLSNRYLDLDPVIGSLATDAGLTCRVRYDIDIEPSLREAGKLPSIWAVLARDEGDLGPLADDPRWRPARVSVGMPVWTDDWSSLIMAWRSRPLKGLR